MLKNTLKTKNFFKKLDIFGQPIPLYFDGHPLYTTTFGGIITMIIVCVITAFVIVLADGLLSRRNYIISIEKDFTLNSGLVDLSKDFMFSIGIQDPTITLNNSIFSYTITYFTSVNHGNSRIQKSELSIPLHPCTNIDFPDFKKEFDEYYLNYTLCPDLTSISIQGQSYSPLYTYLKVNVSKCVNGTNSGVICATEDYINNYFSQNQLKRIALYFINSIADYDHYENPFQIKFLDELTWIISPDTNLRISTDLYFGTTIVHTLDNVFGIGNGWNSSAIGYQLYKNDNIFMPDITKFNEYLEIYIKSSTRSMCIKRKYENFTQILSILAGIWNILYLFLGQIAKRYNNALFKIDLANVLYDFDTVASGVNDPKDIIEDDDDEIKGKYNLKKSTMFKGIEKIIEKYQFHSNNNSNDFTKFPPRRGGGIRKSIMDESKTDMVNSMDFLGKFNAFRSKRRHLKYSAKDIWTNLFHCCSTKILKKKNLLLHKANAKLASDIDIRIILKKFKEVSEIKNTVFDENQLAIFDFVPPELIALDHDGEPDQIKKIHIRQQTKYLQNQLKNLCFKKEEYFFRQGAYDICKSRTDTISQNLIDKLDQETKEIFELLNQRREGTSNNFNTLGTQSIFQTNHQTNQIFQKNSISAYEYNLRENSEPMFGTPINEYRKIEYLKRGESLVVVTNPQNLHSVIRDSSTPQEENIVYAPLIHNKSTPNQDVKLLSKKNIFPFIKNSIGIEPLHTSNIEQETKKSRYLTTAHSEEIRTNNPLPLPILDDDDDDDDNNDNNGGNKSRNIGNSGNEIGYEDIVTFNKNYPKRENFKKEDKVNTSAKASNTNANAKGNNALKTITSGDNGHDDDDEYNSFFEMAKSNRNYKGLTKNANNTPQEIALNRRDPITTITTTTITNTTNNININTNKNKKKKRSLDDMFKKEEWAIINEKFKKLELHNITTNLKDEKKEIIVVIHDNTPSFQNEETKDQVKG